jgi:hypothetical protein
MSNPFVHAVMPDGSRPHVCLFVCVKITVRIPLLPDFIDVNTATGRSSSSSIVTPTAETTPARPRPCHDRRP